METAEAQVGTLRQNSDTVKEQMRVMRETFGIKGDMASGYRIDFAKLVKNLRPDHARDLIAVLSEKYSGTSEINVSNDAPAKPVDVSDPDFVAHLGMESAFKLRVAIDRHYLISGQPGDKPRIKVPAA